MHLIDNVYFIMSYLWWNAHLFNQRTDIFYRVVGGGIQFVNVIRTLFVESAARLAFVASFAVFGGMLAINSLGKDTCTSCFADSPGSAKKISVSQFLGGYGIFQSGGKCPLSYHRIEGGGAILSG